MSELFNIKKVEIKKLGVFGIICLFGVCTFISGRISVANADGSISVLPISRGGTGANQFANGQALIGNGSQPLSSLAIDATPTANSNNLITSGAAEEINQTALTGQAYNNLYKKLEEFTDLDDLIYILGYSPTDNTRKGVSFSGNFIIERDNPGITATNTSDIRLYIALSHSSSYIRPEYVSINVWAKLGAQPIRFFEVGQFTYKEELYIGIRINNTFNGEAFINGYFNYTKAGIKKVCETSEDICVGKKIAFTDAQDYVAIKNMND
jgi:hypothetical protein